jgi:photosystem II stability/assembly factor-like uncharacterized protein
MLKNKKLLILYITLLSYNILFSQAGWIQQQINTNNNILGISFINSQTGYAAGWYGTIFKTNDGGANWVNINYSQQLGFQSINFLDTNTGWIFGQNGTILKTINKGISWTPQISNTSNILLFNQFVNLYTGWAVGYSGTILKTTNGGNNWNFQVSGTVENLVSVIFTSVNNGWISGDYGKILKTTNSGLNWINVPTSIPNNLGKLFFVSDNTGWVPGTNGLILKTTNGGINWIIQSSGTNSYLICANFQNANTGFICGAGGTILKTTNGGDNWTQQTSGSINDLHFIKFISNSTGWATGFNGTVLKTTTGGVSYVVQGFARYSDNNQPITSGYIKAVRLNKSDGSIIVVDSAQIQTDGSYILPHVTGDTVDIGLYPNSTTQNDYVVTHYPSTPYWERAILLAPSGNISNLNIGAIRMYPVTANNSVNGKVMRITNTSISNVKDAVLYAKLGNNYVRCGVTDGNGVYHLPSLPTGTVKIIANRFGYSGDSTTVNVTPLSNIDSVNFYLRYLYIGISKIESVTPSCYRLYQNYPNPFNPTTNIKYQISNNKLVTLKIYNILGKEVADLVNEKQSPGVYEVTFDGSGMSSGIYFYTLTSGDFKATKRFVLIK